MPAEPIDLAHLDRQTGGDRALGQTVLRMFAERAPADLARLRAASGQARREIAHLIVGSARAIGAGAVASAAGAVEAGGDDLAALDRALADALRFIAGRPGA